VWSKQETTALFNIEEATMGRCEVCGNEYYLAFEVIAAGQRHVFDSFECAIHKLAPICNHCGCRVIGHGIESGGKFYCCVHCARPPGHDETRSGQSKQPPGVHTHA
jgi:hypothetical protein